MWEELPVLNVKNPRAAPEKDNCLQLTADLVDKSVMSLLSRSGQPVLSRVLSLIYSFEGHFPRHYYIVLKRLHANNSPLLTPSSCLSPRR